MRKNIFDSNLCRMALGAESTIQKREPLLPRYDIGVSAFNKDLFTGELLTGEMAWVTLPETRNHWILPVAVMLVIFVVGGIGAAVFHRMRSRRR